MEGSVYRLCFCRHPETKRRYKKGECPDWNKRGHGKWYFKYDAPTAPGEDRRRPEVGPFDTKAEAQTELAKALVDAGAGMPAVDRSLKVAAYLLSYQRGKMNNKARTRETDDEAFRLYWIPALGSLHLGELRDHHVIQVLVTMEQINRPLPDGEEPSEMLRRMMAARADSPRVLAEGETPRKKSVKPLSAARIVRMYAPFRAAMNAAYRTKKIGLSPCLGVEPAGAAKVNPLAWTPAREAKFCAALAKRVADAEAAVPAARVLTTVKRQALWASTGLRPCPVMVWMPAHTGQFLDYLDLVQERQAALFITAAYCGLRRDELLGLTWANIELAERILWVMETGGGDGPKSEAGMRPVPMQQVVVDALAAWREVQQLEQAMLSDCPDHDLVFTKADGEPQNGQWVSVRFETLAYRAGLPPVRFHDVRHGTASLLKASGADSKMIAAVLGHTRSDFTDRYYVTLFPDVQQAAAEAAASMVPRKGRKRDSGGPRPPQV